MVPESPKEVKSYLDPRLPSPDKVAKILANTGKILAQAREFNAQVTEEFYQAGMKKIAAKFWDMARTNANNPYTLMIYARILHDHFEQNIKRTKNDLTLRQLKLIEAKAKALQELANNTRTPTTEVFVKAREIFYPETNGHAPKQIENGFTS